VTPKLVTTSGTEHATDLRLRSEVTAAHAGAVWLSPPQRFALVVPGALAPSMRRLHRAKRWRRLVAGSPSVAVSVVSRFRLRLQLRRDKWHDFFDLPQAPHRLFPAHHSRPAGQTSHPWCDSLNPYVKGVFLRIKVKLSSLTFNSGTVPTCSSISFMIFRGIPIPICSMYP
jgi:hypothetical protein